MLATQTLDNKTLMKFSESRDGILAWMELKEDNEFNGSKELRMQQLEQQAAIPYSVKYVGGISAYIDKLQVII